MSAYFIASYKIKDPAGYEPYVPAVIPILQACGCEILVADYSSEAVEGAPGAGVTVRYGALRWRYGDTLLNPQTPPSLVTWGQPLGCPRQCSLSPAVFLPSPAT